MDSITAGAVHADSARMIEWSRLINRQWAGAGDGRAQEAEKVMQQLAADDPESLHQGALRAFRLMMEAGAGADLRSVFYRAFFEALPQPRRSVPA